MSTLDQLERRLRTLEAEYDQLVRQNVDEGGFNSQDARALRMLALGREIDDVELELDLATAG